MKGLGCIFTLIGALFLDWLLTVAILASLAACFGFDFNLNAATGLWILIGTYKYLNKKGD